MEKHAQPLSPWNRALTSWWHYGTANHILICQYQ